MIPSLLRRLSRGEDAVTAAEYAMMLALIIVVVIAAVNAVGNTSLQIWNKDTNAISSATSS